MSVTIDIIPMTEEPIKIGKLAELWLAEVPENLHTELGKEITIAELVSKRKLASNEDLLIGFDYIPLVKIQTRLGIGLMSNKEGFVADKEYEYLKSYAQSSTEDTLIQHYAKEWHKSGYNIYLTSYMGRPKQEFMLMQQLAIALAVVTKGCILITNAQIFERTGIYTPAEFRKMNPLESGDSSNRIHE